MGAQFAPMIFIFAACVSVYISSALVNRFTTLKGLLAVLVILLLCVPMTLLVSRLIVWALIAIDSGFHFLEKRRNRDSSNSDQN